MNQEMREICAGCAAFATTVALWILMLIYVNGTVWQGEIAYARNHPEAGWKVRLGKIVQVGATDFGVSPPQTKSAVRFTDYYGHEQTGWLHFEVYPISVGTSTEVDVGRNGSIYAPSAFEYDYQNDNSPQDWDGPRAADNTGLVFEQLGLTFTAIPVGFILFLLYYGLFALLGKIPEFAGRLGTR